MYQGIIQSSIKYDFNHTAMRYGYIVKKYNGKEKYQYLFHNQPPSKS
jgi:hypothetical protein